ncbi:MAG: selenide, water dikinase SelD [Chitinophagia bacterium]|nr:selenide, water dikinase SelD [Chitinophagia bacterium]
MSATETIRLTQYSRGAGCGCKIAPQVLQEIIGKNSYTHPGDRLLVGNDTADDAAAYDLGNGTALISTTDFFMPIVDDAFDFGRVAAANAISDVYAMGGQPIMALAILGWPVDTLPAALAGSVLEGARAICKQAGIPLAGGHTIDSAEPIFGLSVNGLCATAHLKRNNTATEGDVLFITKPLGTGILSTAQKRGVIEPAHLDGLIGTLTTLNQVGSLLGALPGVTAMTDITGFGLAGHLLEMTDKGRLTAVLQYAQLPVLDGVRQYLAARIVPDATYRNWNGYGSNLQFGAGVDVMEAFSLLPDPQTNGGLLIAVQPAQADEVAALLTAQGLYATQVGWLEPRGSHAIKVEA